MPVWPSLSCAPSLSSSLTALVSTRRKAGRELWSAPAKPVIWTTGRQDHGAQCRENLLCSIDKLYTGTFDTSLWSRAFPGGLLPHQKELKGEGSLSPLLPSLCSSRIWNTAQHMLILSNFWLLFSVWVVLSIPSFTSPVQIQWVHWVFHDNRHIIKPLDMVPNRSLSWPLVFYVWSM